MNHTTDREKAILVFVLVAFIGALAVIFPTTRDSQPTGLLGGGQMLPSHLRTTVITDEPCKIVHCNRPVAEAYPVGTDEYGNIWCKCDGLAELYYRVSPIRKY